MSFSPVATSSRVKLSSSARSGESRLSSALRERSASV